MMPPLKPPLSIPRINNEEPLPIEMSPGDVLFVVGANGTGKSGLLQHLYRIYTDNESRPVLWIPAHRQTWMDDSRTMSAHEKFNHERNFRSHDRHFNSRWFLNSPGYRPRVTLSNLVLAVNERSRKIANAVDDGQPGETVAKEMENRARQLNAVIDHANLPITISISRDESIEARNKEGDLYAAAELSDGERAMLLLAADVLTCAQGTLLLIDEPEVHIHRSIVSPVLQEIFSIRDDCYFVISTHELLLPIDNPSARILVTRRCEWGERSIQEWEVDLFEADSLEEGVKKDILGARRGLLYVEGNERSLDRLLYATIFPDLHIVPKDDKKSVEQAVSVVRGIDDIHWLNAYGLVDNDGTNAEDRTKDGIYSLNVCAVESLYYDPFVQRLVSEETFIGYGETGPRLAKAKEESMKEFSKEPSWGDDYEDIIRNHPIKKGNSALVKIARGLGFPNRSEYEAAVRRILKKDEKALQHVKDLLGGLPEQIERDRATSLEHGT